MRLQASFPAEGLPDEISRTVLVALSEAAQVDVATLQPPLNDAIDTDALEHLLESADERTGVTFPYEGWEVKVQGDGTAEVGKAPERR